MLEFYTHQLSAQRGKLWIYIDSLSSPTRSFGSFSLLGLWDIQWYNLHRQIFLVIVNGTLYCYTNCNEQLVLYSKYIIVSISRPCSNSLPHPLSTISMPSLESVHPCLKAWWVECRYPNATTCVVLKDHSIKTFTFCHTKVNFRSLKSLQSCCFLLKYFAQILHTTYFSHISWVDIKSFIVYGEQITYHSQG